MLKHQVADSSYQLGSPLVYIFESPLCMQRKKHFNVKTVHEKSLCRRTITHVYFYGRTSCPVSCGLKLDGRIAAAVLNPRHEDPSSRLHASSPSLSFCSHSLFRRPCCFSSFLAILTAARPKQCHVGRAHDVTPTWLITRSNFFFAASFAQVRTATAEPGWVSSHLSNINESYTNSLKKHIIYVQCVSFKH